MSINNVGNTPQTFVYPSQGNNTQTTEIAEKFQVGDLVFTKMDKGFHKVYSFAVLFQKIVNWIYPKNNTPSYSDYTHVAIVVGVDKEAGRVLIADAVPSHKNQKDLRIVDLLCDKSCDLKKNKNLSYEVVRITDKALTPFMEATVKLAKNLATKASYLTSDSDVKPTDCRSKKSHYSFWNAIKAIFSKQPMDSNPLSPDSTKRIFKQIYDTTKANTTAAGGSKPRKFFCSSFVGYLLQAGEATAAWEKLKSEHTDIEAFPQDGPQANVKKPVSHWAKRMADKHGKELDRLMKHYRFDAKKIGPGELRSFFKSDMISSFFLKGR